MEKTSEKGIQILKQDKEENLRFNKGIATIQRIAINWGKEEIKKGYLKDTGAKELRRKKWNNDEAQEREGILHWKG